MWLTAEEVDALPEGAEVLGRDGKRFVFHREGPFLFFHDERGCIGQAGPFLPDGFFAHVGPRRLPPVGLLEWRNIGSLSVASLTLALAVMETERALCRAAANLGITPLEL